MSQENDFEEVSVSNIAKALNFKEEDVNNILNASKDYIPIDSPISGSDENERLLSETLEDENYKSPEQYMIEDSLRKAITKSLSTLPRKEKEVLSLRFGLNGITPMSLKEIGEAFDLTKERIRQIEKKAIQRLRHPSRSLALKIFLLN